LKQDSSIPGDTHAGGSDGASQLSPELRSWITNCVVPILVREYLSAQNETYAPERDGETPTDSEAA